MGWNNNILKYYFYFKLIFIGIMMIRKIIFNFTLMENKSYCKYQFRFLLCKWDDIYLFFILNINTCIKNKSEERRDICV